MIIQMITLYDLILFYFICYLEMGSNLTPACCFGCNSPSAQKQHKSNNQPLSPALSSLNLKRQPEDLSTLPTLELQSLNSRSQLLYKTTTGLTIDNITFQVEQRDENDNHECPSHTNSETHRLQRNTKLSLRDFELLKTTGKGAFGKVHMACLNQNNSKDKRKLVAIKQIGKSKIKKSNLTENIIFQKQILDWSDSEFITKMYGAFRDEQNYYLVLQWAQGGDLFSLIKSISKRRLIFREGGQQFIRFVLGCLVKGLQYLHGNDIIYGDLKPQNMLIFEDGYIKLSDFGLSKKLLSNTSTHQSNFQSGTKQYFAPQIVMRNFYSKESDLWALGVVAYELANNYLPFELEDILNARKFTKEIIKSSRDRKWRNKSVSSEFKELVDSLLQLNPSLRLGSNGLSEIKEHIFFKDFDWQALEEKRMPSPLLPILMEKKQNKIISQNCNITNNIYINTEIVNSANTLQTWSTQNSELYQ